MFFGSIISVAKNVVWKNIPVLVVQRRDKGGYIQMNRSRRQFFKTVAATVAGAVAVGVAPRVVAEKQVRMLTLDSCGSKIRQQGMSGITHAQICDLISTTLKDLPPQSDLFPERLYHG